ncbi:MAG: GHKL domain-containing protein [Bacteroidetes bacterium]|nr:GHKL domain-containing protein [Bacteroidota bacterium]
MLINKKVSIYLFFALFFILGIAVVSLVKQIQFNDALIQSRIQSRLISEEKKTDNILYELNDLLDQTQNHDSIHLKIESSGLTKTPATYLIYKSDSLIYWSSNQIPVFDQYPINQFRKRLNFLSNGYYDLRQLNSGDLKLLGLIPIKHEYTYENQYLKSDFAEFLKVPSKIKFSEKPGDNVIFNSEKEYLFSLKFPEYLKFTDGELFLLTLFYFLAYIFLIGAIYHAYHQLFQTSKRNILILLGFTIDVIILRLIIFYFHVPDALFTSPLFSPEFFASSYWAPSLGDLLLHLIALFAIALNVHNTLQIALNKLKLSVTKQYLFVFMALIITFVMYRIMIQNLESLVFNSGISFNLNDISSIDIYSVLGFVCFGVMILIFVFFSYNLLVFSASLTKSNNHYFAVIVAVSVSFYSYCKWVIGCDEINIIFLFLYLLIFLWLRKRNPHQFNFGNALVFILLFSVFTTYILYQSNYKREKEIRQAIAQNLIEQRDPIAEYKFAESVEKIKSDSTLSNLMQMYPFPEIEQLETATDYIVQNYYSNYWSKFEILVTICDSARTLNIRPDDITINCDYYFADIIDNYGKQTNSPNFYFIDEELNDDYYLGQIHFPFKNDSLSIYVEFYSKSVPKGLGYPELLKDFEGENEINWSEYSYARYENNELFFRLGKYFYSMNLENYISDYDQPKFFDYNGFNHYFLPVDTNAALIISIKKPGLLEITAPFSYISIFYGLLVYLVYLILKGRIQFRLSKLGFRQRLQFSITILIVASFFLVGVGSSIFIVSLNNNKNHSILSEKAHSVLVELEHKLAEEESLPPEMEMYLSDLLYKFSMVFFTDINLYDAKGTLLATSRAEIFNRGLISTKMNAQAYLYLHDIKKSLYIHHEAIGEYPFLSAYLPLRNVNNELIAYINLPYFAKQDELTNEISTFLVGFLNIYIILIAIAIYIALFVSNYISKPLQLLKGKLSTLKLGETEQKIDWKKDDEIGSLVEEYNRMVDELAKSAELLARSERESAWREMAKQIAHEIKNPLTPMKLSVQYLEKAWDEKLSDWDQRLHRFTQTIVEQIDSLSVIASAFSDFANMPKSNFTKIELTKIIDNAIGIFKNTTEVRFECQYENKHYILGDKEQFLRVFNNLIKNSLQAIIDDHQGLIRIKVFSDENHHIIQFSDNGSGIPGDQKDKVFYPNFTTKSGGTGLGLALVKNIINNAGGTIDFESNQTGTTFLINLPAYSDSEDNLSKPFQTA